MINTLDDYISNSLPQWGEFSTNPNLVKKVDPAGRILPFRGNTAVFLLDEEVKQTLAGLRDSLYAAAPEMLAEKLRTDTFHVTLHDLANGTPDDADLPRRMELAAAGARPLLRPMGEGSPIRMRATWLFNMVSTSIVLGLSPADGESWMALDGMYMALENVVRLGYALSPHITMAYFRPGTYTPEQVARLRSALRPVELDITLSRGNLVLQNFEDMNCYYTV